MLTLVLGMIILVLVALIVLALILIVIMRFPWGKTEVRDVTDGPLPLFNSDEIPIQELARLGFQSLGILEWRYFWKRNQPSALWYYVDINGMTYAVVSNFAPSQTGLMVAFTSWFRDESLLETLMPVGETIHTPTYHAQFVKADLALGYAKHLEQIQAFAPLHGEPVVIHDVRQVMAFDQADRKWHRGRRYRRLRIILLLMSLYGLIGIGAALYANTIDVSGAMGNFLTISNQFLIPAGLMLLCFVGIGILAYRTINPSGALDAQGQ
jgi:hypothetical protein